MTSSERLVQKAVLALILVVQIEGMPRLPSGWSTNFDCKTCRNCTYCRNPQKYLQLKYLQTRILKGIGYTDMIPGGVHNQNKKPTVAPPKTFINTTLINSGFQVVSQPTDLCNSGILQFSFNKSISDISGAELYVHFIKGKRRKPRVVRLTIFSVNSKGKYRRKVASLKTRVSQTMWQRIPLPLTKLRRLLKAGEDTLRLMIKCKRCTRNVRLVLPFKERKRRKRRRRNCSKKAKSLRSLEQNRPFLFIHPSSEDSDRKKRSHRMGLQCTTHKIEQKQDCCRHSEFISFSELGWNSLIISPTGFPLTECQGHCKNNLLHPSILSNHKGSPTTSLCVPSSKSAFEFLYFDANHDIARMRIDDVIIDKCECQ